MLKLGLICGAAAALVLAGAQPALAQGAIGLSSQLDAAEKKLDADIQDCRPIDVEDYRKLSKEVYRNFETFVAAAKAGVPVDSKLLESDHRRAKALLDKASAAGEKPCPPPGKAEPPGQAVQPPKEPTPLVRRLVHLISRSPFEELEDDSDDAIEDLDEAIWDCYGGDVEDLIPKLEALAKRAHATAEAAKETGEFSNVNVKAAEQLANDLEKAITRAKKYKCPIRLLEKSALRPDLSPFAARILETHNEERFAVHVPALRWNVQLETDATAYAHTLSQTHQLLHAPREGRGIERENILQARIGWSPERMMQSWTLEKRDFVPGDYPNVARDGNWLNVSHYTQMIWPTTTDIGCGYAEGGGYGWLVCRYSPGGNKDGKPVGMPSGIPERG